MQYMNSTELFAQALEPCQLVFCNFLADKVDSKTGAAFALQF